MTIITKPISEKKSEKLATPLVDNQNTNETFPNDVEAQTPCSIRMLVIPARARRVSTTTTLCLLLAALTVVGIGILGGTYFYRQYIRAQLQFHGRCIIPYYDMKGTTDSLKQDPLYAQFDDLRDNYVSNSMLMDDIHKVLQEEFELDLDKEAYEKITVPDFNNGRSGRFIYDFNSNITSIVDITGNRCFIMPLNRSAVLPPKSFLDLVNKIWDGHYKLNTEIVRETMRVVTPPIDQDEVRRLGKHIYNECKNGPVYKLEKYVSGVVKRSADSENEVQYTHFAGTGIIEFNIVNLDDAKAYEASQLT